VSVSERRPAPTPPQVGCETQGTGPEKIATSQPKISFVLLTEHEPPCWSGESLDDHSMPREISLGSALPYTQPPVSQSLSCSLSHKAFHLSSIYLSNKVSSRKCSIRYHGRQLCSKTAEADMSRDPTWMELQIGQTLLKMTGALYRKFRASFI
jgi:hypothetical protein